MGISIQNFRWEKDWTISAHNKASIEIKSLLFKKDFKKGTHALCELNLWICGLETKGKTPIWFKKLKETISEDLISRRIKGVYAQQVEINESQIKPKKENVAQKIKERMENLVYDNSSSSSITPTSKILKMRENEVKNVSLWIKRKNKGGWVTAISFKHLKNMIAPEKKTRGKQESEVKHVTLAESWD
ncbi:19593_t:CDS:2, partial [Gigaspora rosea]